MQHPIDRSVQAALSGRLPMVIFVLAILFGLFALNSTPREEEPQIVVPLLEIRVSTPNINAGQVERQVTTPMEKLLAQIPGVEHVYSTTQTGGAVVNLRFYVGEDRERAILNTYTKLYANQEQMPAIVSQWQVKPIEVDDVPIVMLGLYSKDPSLYSDFELGRFAEELSTQLQQIPDTSEVKVISNRTRQVQVLLDATALAAHQTTAVDVFNAIQVSNQVARVGSLRSGDQEILLESGDALYSAQQLPGLVINVVNGKSVLLRDVAEVRDGPSEPESYQWLSYTDKGNADNARELPMVTLSVAKQPGTNAVAVAEEVHRTMTELSQRILPPQVGYQILRDYGQTADGKVNDLTQSLAFAVFTVVVFVGVFLGWRPAIVVGLAVPICYGITLLLDFAFGYTINRVTLFALILSLGLLVDDPITGIDNISRFIRRKGDKSQQIVAAISEIRVPLLMSTLTIVMAFIPLAFITGMMGPYMAPMAFNVPASVMLSTFVAFLVTPWLALKLLKREGEGEEEDVSQGDGIYGRVLRPLLESRSRAKMILWGVLVLFMLSAALPVFRAVPLKLLPFDNKNEVQILIDMPEGTALEETAAMARRVEEMISGVNEITAVASFVGKPSSMDFNGMVRGYYRRQAPHLGELRLLLLDKSEREHQSHAVVLRLRELVAPLSQGDTRIKVVEVPPGPPVLSTLVAEVYADPFISDETHRDAAHKVAERLAREPHVVEVDTSLAATQPLERFVIEQDKAALSGIAAADIAQTLLLANQGMSPGIIHDREENQPLPIVMQLPFSARNQLEQLLALQVRGRLELAKTSDDYGLKNAPLPLVALSELGEMKTLEVDPIISHKDLRRVIYVMAELNGRTPAEVIADVSSDELPADAQLPASAGVSDWMSRSFFMQSGGGDYWQLPAGTEMRFGGEGEWRITIRVFRDMGIAFAFALAAIFVILRIQTRSVSLSLIIMSAIPLTIIGIMPGFWVLNQFGERTIAGAPEPVLFTATAMIGMIALAGIVVRNSLILVEFINQARGEGMNIKDALVAAGQVRMRPVLLTAGTTLLGNLVITLDPVFSGLAIAIIFGIIASTLFSLLVVPLVYYLVFAGSEKETTPQKGVEYAS